MERKMAEIQKGSRGAVALSAILGFFALLFWVLAVATLADLGSSDPAGNALARVYGALEIIILWLLLAAIAITTAVKGAVPKPALLAEIILVPGSGVAAMMALDLLSKPNFPPFLLPLFIPGLIPPLIVAFSFWALLPPVQAIVSARLAAGATWGAILVLCLAVVPMQQVRNHASEQVDSQRKADNANFANIPANAPLWDLTPFLSRGDSRLESAAVERIRGLARRQSDTEIMLDRGDFPLGYLGRFDLEPTPAICEKARALLRKRVEPLVLKAPQSKPYDVVASPVADAVAAMSWLVGYDCSCNSESLAWQAMAESYKGTNFDVHRLMEIRDPKELGRVARERPERATMLTAKAHLKAWLKFADDDKVLVGARNLDHRTTDAIEMLRDRYDTDAPRIALKYLPFLDLQPTPVLCASALTEIRVELGRIFRPKPEDPRPYDELLGRLGNGGQFPALKWLAANGCDADAALGDAETLVRAYQVSPQSAALLDSLAVLHRKP